MNRIYPFSLLILFLSTILALTAVRREVTMWSIPLSGRESAASVTRAMSGLPLSFVPNAGQHDEAVRFAARAMGGDLYFTEQGVVLALPGGTAGDIHAAEQSSLPKAGNQGAGGTVLRLRFEGANPDLILEQGAALPGVVNYVLGNDPAEWRTGLHTFAGIQYRNLYPGIELAYDGIEGLLKGTYTVEPDADPARIRWRYEGASDVRVDGQTRELLITVADNGSVLAEQAPVAWQDKDGERVPVAVRYAVAAHGSVGFELGDYDRALPLVIDPTLVYSTYLGGSSAEIDAGLGGGIAVDSAGNAYVTGFTASTDFPTASPFQSTCPIDQYLYCGDAFVTKLAPDGQSLVYSTYLGGSGGDYAADIVVDDAGNAYIVGNTQSVDFPTANAFQAGCAGTDTGCYDAFVTKLAANGQSIVYSTFLGGSSNYEAAYDLAVDGAGNAYVTGYTYSVDFPTANAIQPACALDQYGFCRDVFITKFAADGKSLVYSTFLGGNEIYEEVAFGIAVDDAGNAYVTGYTQSFDFPTANALQSTCRPDPYQGLCWDAFVTKLAADGQSLVYSTFLGGSIGDSAWAIAVDSAGSAYVTGNTGSTDFPTANAFQPACATGQGYCNDVFVTKLAADGQALVYSTYLGGNMNGEGATGIAVDETGSAYVAGYTYSTDFPTADPIQAYCPQDQYENCYDAFVTKLAPDGQGLVYSTYLGGSKGDHARDIAVDSPGNAYVMGATSSTDFPTANAFQATCAGPTGGYCSDAFVTKLGGDGESCPSPAITAGAGGTGSLAANSVAQTMSGRVLWGPAYQELVNMGVEGATVTLGCAETTTDSQGSFNVTVEPGTYPLTIRYALFEDHQSGANTLAASWVEKEVTVTIDAGTTQLEPVTGFGDLVKLEALGAETEVDAALTAQGFTGSADLPFGDDPSKPLKIDVAYTRASNLLNLTANGQSTLTLGGQSVTITSFEYNSPSNTGSIAGFGTILGRPARMAGTLNNSEIMASADLCFAKDSKAQADQACFTANPSEEPLHLTLTYNLAGKQLSLTATNATAFSWYGQTVQLQSFSYSYPGNALSLQASAQIDVNGLQVDLEVHGVMSGQMLLLEGNGDASAQGVTVRFDALRLTASNFIAEGRVWLPGQDANDDNQPPPAGTFNTTFARGMTAVTLTLQGLHFAGYPATEVTLHIATNPLNVHLTGKGQAMIGGRVSEITISSSIDTGSSTLAAQATIAIEEASAQVAVQYNWLTGAFSGNGTLLYKTWPCPGQSPVEHKIKIEIVGNAKIKLNASSLIAVNCAGENLLVSLEVKFEDGLAELDAGMPVTLNGATGTLKFLVRGDGTYVEMRLMFELKFGGSSAPQFRPFTISQGSDPVRVLLTDTFGRRIGYDAATGQIVNEVPGASYDGVVNGVDVFTLPGIVGGYVVTLSSDMNTTVVMEAYVPASNASATYSVTLDAGKPETLLVGVAPREDGSIAVGLSNFVQFAYLPVIIR